MAEYVLRVEILYEAENVDEAGLLAAELVALPLAHDAVIASEGDYYTDLGVLATRGPDGEGV